MPTLARITEQKEKCEHKYMWFERIIGPASTFDVYRCKDCGAIKHLKRPQQ